MEDTERDSINILHYEKILQYAIDSIMNKLQQKRKLQKLVKDVRKKYLTFKLGKTEEDQAIRRLFSPLTEKMNSSSSTPTPPKTSLVELPKLEEKPFVEEKKDPVYPEEASTYILSTLGEQRTRLIDRIFGPIYRPYLSKWMIGNSEIQFDAPTKKIILYNQKVNEDTNEVTVDEHRFAGTKGLYALLFKSKPNRKDYEPNDMRNYRKILLLSNMSEWKFHPNNLGSSKEKYFDLILPLLDPDYKVQQHKGGTLVSYNEKPIEYVYWNDINELVSRLRLLYASKLAGNTSNDNEIEAIIEELREAQIIY